MSRPRIRTLKPECWQDEALGALSRDARLLWVGLITLADDEGRFRALDAVILGHCFPYDPDAARKLKQWMRQLVDQGLVDLYEHNGMPYGLLPRFTDHQKINRAKPSILPAPFVNGHGRVTNGSVTA